MAPSAASSADIDGAKTDSSTLCQFQSPEEDRLSDTYNILNANCIPLFKHSSLVTLVFLGETIILI